MNIVVIRGSLSSDPRETILQSGTEIINWEVTTRIDGEARSVPVQWNDPSAAIRRVTAGDEVVILGSIRRRWFRAGAASVSRTEVIGETMVRATQPAALARLLDRAQARLVPSTG